MSTEEKARIPEGLQKTSPKETQEIPSGPYQETLLKESEETPAEVDSESPGCDGADPHKWDNKMELQRLLSGKPDLEIIEKRIVLFVDDDEAILRSLEKVLLDESYDKLFVKSSKKALEVLKQKKVHVIVTDMCMPEMTGLELLRIARKECPNIIGIIITGYELDDELQKAVEHREVFRLVTKPLWRLGGKFERLIRWALDHPNLQQYQVVGK